MSWLQFWRKVYSLETLDTRFVVSANTPPKVQATDFELNSVQGEISSSQSNGLKGRSASRDAQSAAVSDIRSPLWDTMEFYFYYFVFVTVVPTMFYVAYSVSKRTTPAFIHQVFDLAANPRPASHPNYSSYVGLLSDGWIPGRKVVSWHALVSQNIFAD